MRPAFLAIIIAACGLAACGGAPSPEFMAAIRASCEKTQDGKVDCACVAAALDEELDRDSKATLLAINVAIDSGKSQREALQETGLDPAEAQDLMAKLVPALAAARASCART